MTNLDSILRSRDINLPTKVCLVKVMVFPVAMNRCESWTIKKAERQRIYAFELWLKYRQFWCPARTENNLSSSLNLHLFIYWFISLQFWEFIFLIQTIFKENVFWIYFLIEVSVQFSHSIVSNSLQPTDGSPQASLSITNSQSLVKLRSIKSVMPFNHLILCRPLLLPPSIFPSIRVFSNESVLHISCPEYWSFSFNISPSNEYSGLISFRMDWLDLLAVQGTLKSLQHHSSKASILRRSAFFIVQLSHPYMITGKAIALTR